jgi:hypothetical protein
VPNLVFGGFELLAGRQALYSRQQVTQGLWMIQFEDSQRR